MVTPVGIRVKSVKHLVQSSRICVNCANYHAAEWSRSMFSQFLRITWTAGLRILITNPPTPRLLYLLKVISRLYLPLVLSDQNVRTYTLSDFVEYYYVFLGGQCTQPDMPDEHQTEHRSIGLEREESDIMSDIASDLIFTNIWCQYPTSESLEQVSWARHVQNSVLAAVQLGSA